MVVIVVVQDLKNSAMKEIKQRMKTCPSFTLGELYILHELMRRNETQFDMHSKC